MNNDIFKILTNTMIDFVSNFQPQENQENQQTKKQPTSKEKNKKEKFFEDDFSGDKRKNRIFTASQKEQCWKKVNLFFIKK